MAASLDGCASGPDAMVFGLERLSGWMMGVVCGKGESCAALPSGLIDSTEGCGGDEGWPIGAGSMLEAIFDCDSVGGCPYARMQCARGCCNLQELAKDVVWWTK